MAPIKFEEQLKEKLEKRTIQPSSEAWSTLANRLDQQDKKQNHKTFWWLGIAASIVGIILVSTFVFDNSKSKISIPTVVDIKKGEEGKTNSVSSDKVEVAQQENIKNSEDEMMTSNEGQVNSQVAKTPNIVSPKNETILKETIVKETVASNDVKQENQNPATLGTPVNPSDFEQAKLNDVVAEINRLQTENNGVSEKEIDSLLKRAEREILTNRIDNENTRTVDANALLQDVEADLEQSFRAKALDALKGGYETVKTAVAERNN